MKHFALGSILALLLAGCAGPGSDPTPTREDLARDARTQSRALEGVNATAEPQQFPPWPDLASAKVRPGTVVRSDGGSCTSNFLFRSSDNVSLYLGLAAHCVEGMKTNATVDVEGAKGPGRLAYSSWAALNATGCSQTPAPESCDQDFALIELDAEDRPVIHPAVWHYGGPVGLMDSQELVIGDRVITYGQSPLRAGAEPTNPREGVVTMEQSGPKFLMATATPGVPGDSGSAVMTKDGRAVGVLVDIQIAPFAGQNGVVGLSQALEVAKDKGGTTVELITWDQLDAGL